MSYKLVKASDTNNKSFAAYLYHGRYYDKDLVDLCRTNCFGRSIRTIEQVLKEMEAAQNG